MKAAALICEFNPFHNGHEYIIKKIKEKFPDRALICFMSAEYVQRGEYAVLPAHDRAKAAVLCGADAVFALPVSYTLAPAQRYASCAVKLTECFDGADILCFGSESGDAQGLKITAERLAALDFNKNNSVPYPVQRAEAYFEKYGEKLPALPNDMLALEYIAALENTNIGYELFSRTSAENILSATELRKLMRDGCDVSGYMPKEAFSVLSQAVADGRMRTPELAERSLLCALTDADKREPCADVPPDMAKRIAECAKSSAAQEEYFAKLSVKQYTAARLRRMTLCTALGIGSCEWDTLPPYVMLLAAGKRGREYLSEKPCKIPILTKPASVKELGAVEYFERENIRSRLAFSAQKTMPSLADAYRQSPSVIG